MSSGELGKAYGDGQVIVREGDVGDRMFVIQKGNLRVIRKLEGREIQIAELGAGDIFGEMAIFERAARSATVIAVGEARVLSLDKKSFLSKLHQDPSLAYRLLEQMARRIRKMDEEMTRIKAGMSRVAAGDSE